MKVIISKKMQLIIVFSIIILNAISSVAQSYFSGVGPGDIRMLITLLFITIAFHKFYRATLINTIIVFDLLYLFSIALFAIDIPYTFKVYSKYAVSTLMFIIGYHYIRNIRIYKKVLNIYMLVLFIMVLNIIIASIFNIGSNEYTNSTIKFGAVGVDIVMPLTIPLLVSPLMFLFIKKKYIKLLLIILLLLGFIFTMISMKRTAMFALLIGYIIYLYSSPNTFQLLKKYLGIIIVFILLSPLYINTFYERFTARQEAGRFDINQAQSEEARFIEITNVINDFITGDLSHKLFGSELFNYMDFANTDRMLHTDYATMLSGSGLIGLFLFILIYIVLFQKIYFYRKVFNKNKLIRSITAICFSLLIVTSVLYGAAGSVQSIGVRSLVFFFIGASLGIINQFYNEKRRGKKE